MSRATAYLSYWCIRELDDEKINNRMGGADGPAVKEELQGAGWIPNRSSLMHRGKRVCGVQNLSVEATR
jgi:hypothetical protein